MHGEPADEENPLLSMMLSSANAWAGAARGLVTAQAKRQRSAAMRDGAKQIIGFWAKAMTRVTSTEVLENPALAGV
ncbi:hypothetical protein JMJ56_32540 [Belnapia sp. T18]|uniref:Uncharacterized protein n=1 Tax=Belnapia arida TaxID=2804533 RepID=A0ABS1UDG2_9PROT|nr:hypothetical protein [Belnapia arida]MBL6082694.1 hypothetical protein [Belnapia arida]